MCAPLCSHACPPMCSHMCGPLCSHVCPPWCSNICALICVLVCDLICVLLCALICVLLCALICVLLCALICVLSWYCVLFLIRFHPLHCLGSFAGIIVPSFLRSLCVGNKVACIISWISPPRPDRIGSAPQETILGFVSPLPPSHLRLWVGFLGNVPAARQKLLQDKFQKQTTQLRQKRVLRKQDSTSGQELDELAQQIPSVPAPPQMALTRPACPLMTPEKAIPVDGTTVDAATVQPVSSTPSIVQLPAGLQLARDCCDAGVIVAPSLLLPGQQGLFAVKTLDPNQILFNAAGPPPWVDFVEHVQHWHCYCTRVFHLSWKSSGWKKRILRKIEHTCLPG